VKKQFYRYFRARKGRERKPDKVFVTALNTLSRNDFRRCCEETREPRSYLWLQKKGADAERFIGVSPLTVK
jgi:hypothetical protein